jgi:excisionase family DNA binding protein
MTATTERAERMLHPGEVAEILRVSPRTVRVYATAGKLPYVLTLGGHRRYPEGPIRAIAAAMGHPAAPPWRR